MEFENFKNNLIKKFEHCSKTNEDTIRFLFYYSFVQQNPMNLFDLELEDLHTGIERAKMDLCISKDNVTYFFEFKYTRKLPSNNNIDRTANSAKLIKDLLRLKLRKTVKDRAFLIYVTDRELDKYLRNTNNRFDLLYNLEKNTYYNFDEDFFSSRSKTFYKNICNLHENNNNFTIQCIEKAEFKNKNSDLINLRIYEVL